MPDQPSYRTSVSDRIVIDVHLRPTDHEAEVAELRRGLEVRPRHIPSRYFYDEQGSRLFDEICELPEYYQTRTERRILEHVAREIVLHSGATELLELGSGMSTKTRVLLDAMQQAGQLDRYLPFDVSREIVHEVAEQLVDEYPGLRVHAVIGDFSVDLPKVPDAHHRLVAFLGGTIGNFHPNEAVYFLRDVALGMHRGDHLLLGVDLIKAPDRLEAAYNDSAGITAAFNRNILRVVTRTLGGDFDPERFRHRAFYDRENNWIEMRLVSTRKQTVWIQQLDKTLYFSEGEEMRTELSVKYDRPRAEALLEMSGFELVDWFTDDEDLFGLILARRIG